jgi:tRNA pseudouridine55 synthase
MFTLDALRDLASTGEAALDACLLPVEAGLVGWRSLVLDPEQARFLGQGRTVALHEPVPAGEVNVTDQQGRSLGLGDVGADGLLRARRLFRRAALS